MKLILTILVALLTFSSMAEGGTVSTYSAPVGWTWVGPSGVGVVGDSLTYEAEHGASNILDPLYQRHLLIDAFNAEGYTARVAAKSGATTGALSAWGQWVTSPTHIVMALGTNDRRIVNGIPFMPIAISQANVTTYLNRFPQSKVIMVGIVESAPRGLNVTGPEWNAWLQTEAAARNGCYMDWKQISTGHPEWFQSDLTHMTDAGRKAYRDNMVATVKACI